MVESFKDLNILDTYSSDECDILECFYDPVLSLSVKYDRVTGFFSPKVLAAAARGFAYAIKNNIKIRLLTSVEVDPTLVSALGNNFGSEDFESFANWNISTITDNIEKDYLSILAYLLENNQLEIKVAIIIEDSGIFHQKVGIMTDASGNSLSFSGSNNETVYGWTKNIEEFKVFKDWSPRSVSYFSSDRNNFDKLWNNTSAKAIVLPIDEAVKAKIVRETKTNEDINVVIKRIKDKPKNKPEAKPLRDYQKEAIQKWFEHDCTSIFEMATGTGKTMTAINALKRFKEEKGYLHCVIAVPLQTLTVQWQLEIRKILNDIVIINTSTTPSWKQTIQSFSTLASFNKDRDYIIITTYSSIQKVSDLLPSKDVILLADEMHNMITDRKLEAAADSHYKYRLGLSATPTRIWKKEDSQDLRRIFGNNSFEYGIDEALNNKWLVPFNYYPHIVNLTSEEYEDYIDYSRKINKIRRSLGDVSLSSKPKTESEKELKESLKKLYEYRSFIKKNATGKIDTLIDELIPARRDDKLYHALIYVDNEKMLTQLQKQLLNTTIITSKYIGETPLDERLRIINSLNNERINAIVAIKCLDEGVDIPSARTSYILSNGTEPREYVQRLGRVLRRDDATGKQYADVNDYLVFPTAITSFNDDEERNASRNLIKNELRRAMFFLKRAKNSEEVINGLLLAADEYGFQFDPEELDDELINNKGEEDK